MNDSLKYHVQKITKLPTLPVIAQEILRLVDAEQLSVEKLENIVQNDPAISGKILSVANSSFFGLSASTKTLTSAIMRIGFNNVKNIALGVSLISIMKDEKAGKIFDYQRLFNHSVSVGFVARIIAKDLKLKISEEMLMDGLLHDLGYLVMNNYFADTYKEVISLIEKNTPLLDAEMKVLDFTHADIGAWLAEEWKLPGSILDSVMYHHRPSQAIKNHKRVAVIHLSDYLTTKSVIGPTESDPHYPLDHSSLELLGISESDLADIEARVSGGVYSD